MDSVARFLAHAVFLEEAAADQYDELADALEVHNNPAVVELFRRMAHYSRLHLSEVLERAMEEGELPTLKPWEYQWPGSNSPEAADQEAAHYLMTPYHALQMAHAAEVKAFRFYDDCARSTSNPEVRRLSSTFASEEKEHVEEIETWMADYPLPPEGWDDDLDPPVATE